jgi:hypothetical protein
MRRNLRRGDLEQDATRAHYRYRITRSDFRTRWIIAGCDCSQYGLGLITGFVWSHRPISANFHKALRAGAAQTLWPVSHQECFGAARLDTQAKTL